jgi:hypothetical protein
LFFYYILLRSITLMLYLGNKLLKNIINLRPRTPHP